MNYQPIEAETYTSASAMVRAYSATRTRLMANVRKPVNEVQPIEVQESLKRALTVKPSLVVTYRDQYQKDAHVRAWEAWKAEQGSPCKQYIKRRCEELGIPYKDIVGSSRYRRFTYPRQLLMWELKTFVKPSISYPELGRLFGGRDHTTCLWAVNKIRAQREREKP